MPLAVLPDEGRERSQCLVVGGVKGELAFAASLDEAGADEPIEMVVQGRSGHVELRLKVGRCESGGASV